MGGGGEQRIRQGMHATWPGPGVRACGQHPGSTALRPALAPLPSPYPPAPRGRPRPLPPALRPWLAGPPPPTHPPQVEKVKERCLPDALNYPMLEEYDFKNDTHNPDLAIDLKPNVQAGSGGSRAAWAWALPSGQKPAAGAVEAWEHVVFTGCLPAPGMGTAPVGLASQASAPRATPPSGPLLCSTGRTRKSRCPKCLATGARAAASSCCPAAPARAWRVGCPGALCCGRACLHMCAIAWLDALSLVVFPLLACACPPGAPFASRRCTQRRWACRRRRASRRAACACAPTACRWTSGSTSLRCGPTFRWGPLPARPAPTCLTPLPCTAGQLSLPLCWLSCPCSSELRRCQLQLSWFPDFLAFFSMVPAACALFPGP